MPNRDSSDTHTYQVAIIGAGFCGTMVAVNFAKLMPTARVALIERNKTHGPGLAYGTIDPDHLLNVRAAQMGAFARNPEHFWDWLEAKSETGKTVFAKKDFVPRNTYGHYLTDILKEVCAAHPELSLLHHRIVDMHRLPDARFQLVTDKNKTITAHNVVLALGNFPPESSDKNTPHSNPYAPEVWEKLADEKDVLIIGTGLTSLDLVVTLAKNKTKGTIHLMSRHGLLPREHAEPQPYKINFDLLQNLPKTAHNLYRFMRDETAKAATQNIPWQSVIDALRPMNQSLWRGLPPNEKRRFLRHLRAYWDVHRHRCAVKVMDAFRILEKEGRIKLHCGSILNQTATDNGWLVTWHPRSTTKTENLHVGHVLRCTGPQADFHKLLDPLVQNLIKQSLIASDTLHLGIATAEDYTALDKDGQRVEGLYALGSVLKGRLYESVAVPELRVQAQEISDILARSNRA